MSLPLFLVEPGTLDGRAVVRLDGEEGRHAAVVRRVRVGEQVELSDGAGIVARCAVEGVDRQGLSCRVLEQVEHSPPSPHLVVVQALPKGERGELAVELLTEVGVDEVVPWEAARCVARWRGEREARGLRRWRATAREAAKQSRRARLPVVTGPATTADVAAQIASAELALVLQEGAARPIAAVEPPPAGEFVLVVGPEGGITTEELQVFEAAGALPVRLGPSVLRTSTAGAVAAGVLLARTSRWA
ncbi:MAG TPA: 16S rRNA (uracil(1498)-N(3))-methyltransferase [Jiangellales bacterium]|nr:16S rRNA (uracil(1498)-N(3))-methyltransferase [Jiangellales bacterium]